MGQAHTADDVQMQTRRQFKGEHDKLWCEDGDMMSTNVACQPREIGRMCFEDGGLKERHLAAHAREVMGLPKGRRGVFVQKEEAAIGAF